MSTTTNTTHLLYDGQGGWIEAKAVSEDCWEDDGWEFKSASDAIRWLNA